MQVGGAHHCHLHYPSLSLEMRVGAPATATPPPSLNASRRDYFIIVTFDRGLRPAPPMPV